MMSETHPPEEVLEPNLPIVDPHHHLWDRPQLKEKAADSSGGKLGKAMLGLPRYFVDELLADLRSGHNVRSTVFVDCSSMYRAEGPEELRCVGETEFVNGVAAMFASGTYGDIRACAGIVGRADCTMGDRVVDVLEAHIAAGGGRFRGIRQMAAYDADSQVLGPLSRNPPGLYLSEAFQAGLRRLAPLGLSFDAWLLEPQLPDLITLARGFEDTTIILNHLATPLGIGSYSGRLKERFPIWQNNIRALAQSANVQIKLGGLGMVLSDFPSYLNDPPASSERIAEDWRPYIETAIEAFGADRCMFESNFPVDRGTCDYRTLWNVFKRIAARYSDDEKAALFGGTAARVYRVPI